MRLWIPTCVAVAALLGAAKAPSPTVYGTAVDSCGREDKPQYAGADSCKKCHFKQHAAWKKTQMAKAFDTLKPGAAAEAKKKFGLDEKKDYTTDAKCVECHVTGYGKEGGYPAIVEGKAWTDDEKKRATSMEGVQCEACHGPGSLTNAYKKDNEQYKKEEVTKRGLIAPDEANCKTCHNEKSPTVTKDYKFDYKALTQDKDKIHVHVPLKHKH